MFRKGERVPQGGTLPGEETPKPKHQAPNKIQISMDEDSKSPKPNAPGERNSTFKLE
jgi:hypothetical protein